MLSPSVVESIKTLHCGAFRIQPFCLAGKRLAYYNFDTSGSEFDYPENYEPIPENLFSGGKLSNVPPEVYTASMNRLQKISIESGGIPLGFSIDQEGDFSRDYPYGGINLFPSQMGMTATGDIDLVYEIGRTVALQLSSMGVTTIHSPVLDVNINASNPEIYTRSFSDDPEIAGEYASAYTKGLRDGGLIPTAKHFPGRGDSAIDAHFETPVLDVPRSRLDEVELVPYRRLISEGLESIMIAHNIYTCIDEDNLATVSSKIIKNLLRDDLGFKGVITTDAIAMNALMKKYSLPEACARALQAGADMVLNKTESEYRDQGFIETLRFVEDGRIPEDELNDKVRRIISMKMKRGLFDNYNHSETEAAANLKKEEYKKTAVKAAEKSTILLQDKEKLLPLNPENKILLIEQTALQKTLAEDEYLHRLNFTEAMYRHSENIIAVDTKFCAEKAEEDLIMPLTEEVDIVVMTNHFFRGDRENNTDFVKKIIASGKKVVLVSNTPYKTLSVPNEAGTVLCTFSSTPESMRNAADIIFGKKKAMGKWPLAMNF